MTRKYVWPEGHWNWPIPVTHKHGLRCGEMLFVGGQIDVTPAGEVLHKGDLAAQTQAAVDHIETVLGALGADLDRLVTARYSLADVSDALQLATTSPVYRVLVG